MISNLSTITKPLLAVLLMVVSMLPAWGEDAAKTDIHKYIPVFHGTMRTFYQLSTATGDSRFVVRNARLSAGGFVMPRVDYLLQVDFSDRGKIKLLDAYMRVSPAEGLQVYAGQMRVPFSVESSRQPHLYYFTDVGLVALFGNLRSVGVKAGYTVPSTSLYIEGGIFNASDMTDHTKWNSALTYSIKANYAANGFKPEVGFMSRVPGGKGAGCRINQFDASLSWSYGGLYVEGEYIWRHYCGPMKNSLAYSILADYGWPVKWKWADRMSVQSRFEGVTEGSNGIYVDGVLSANIAARKRLTFGATTTMHYGKVHFDFKVNFEQYFYHRGVKVTADDNNKLTAGAVMYF
ncbi:MAG: OprO/OprP family phosphate-selective porin [Muribaculaceae bacterium]